MKPASPAPATKPVPPSSGPQSQGLLPRLFAGLFGAFLGLLLVKFGNPPIFEKYVTVPANGYEFLFGSPWPIGWAYWLLGLVGVLGLFVTLGKRMGTRWNASLPTTHECACRQRAAPGWLVALPLAWFLWQCLAATQTLDAQLTHPTLKHFAAAVVCFYLGLFSLGRVQKLGAFWLGLLSGFFVVLAVGWSQHFGGLEESRRHFFLYVYPELKEVSPEFLKKIRSDRIFSTLFYPNTLAGALLLLLPAALVVIGQLRKRLTLAARAFVMGVMATGTLGCLYWSGSKGGWLLMLLLALVALLWLPLGKQIKIAVVAAVLVAGLAGFLWKYSGFFRKGATSVVARFDYWQAAVQTTKGKPWFGTGPGTFSIPYQKIKRPESEMARLVHNDYLEQATDSGVIGGLTYSAFIVGALIWSYRRTGVRQDWMTFAVWLGVLAWALQSLLEFGLYIPALAWPAFAFLGWLLGRRVTETKGGNEEA